MVNLKSKKDICAVVVTSMVPRRSGDQIKTGRRDTIHPARYFRTGELTPIYVPNK
jgi:hypothetical protein